MYSSFEDDASALAHMYISEQLKLIYEVTIALAVGPTCAVCGKPRLEPSASMGAGTEEVTWEKN